MSLIYLAVPMDAALMSHDYNQVQDAADMVSARLVQLGHSVFRPDRAFHNSPQSAARAVNLNNEVICRFADALVAVYPTSVSSVGVPLEIHLAWTNGKPAWVWRDSDSAILAQFGTGVKMFRDLDLLLEALPHLTAGPVPQAEEYLHQQVATWTGSGTKPRRGFLDDAGFDLTYSGEGSITIAPGDHVAIPSDVAIQWPDGMWGLLIGRSSTFNHGLMVNPGIIDPGFRGDLFAIVRNVSRYDVTVNPGDRVAQIIPLPALAPGLQMKRVEALEASERGTNGFGSTGK